MEGTGTIFDAIPTVGVFTMGNSVEVPHAGDAKYAICDRDKRWVAKAAGSSDIVAESVGWLVANYLNVPTAPDVAVSTHDGDTYWLSGYLPNPLEWTVADISAIVNADALGRMMVLDIFIGNEDRHQRNLLVFENAAGRRVGAIDMGAALIGNPGTFDPERSHDIHALAPGIVRPVIERGVQDGVTLTAEMDDLTIYKWTAAAGQAAQVPDARVDQMCEVLISRRDAIKSLAEQFLSGLDVREGV